MRIKIDKFELVDGISAVSRVAPSRATLPILGHVLVTAAKGNTDVKLAATDLEQHIEVTVTADNVDGDASIALPCALLARFVGALPAGYVTLEIDSKRLTCEVSCGGASAKLSALSGDEFPPPRACEAEPYPVNPVTLRAALRLTEYAASTDETRATLNGVSVTTDGGGKLTFAATDGRRLAVYDADDESCSGAEWDLILPSRAVAALARMLPPESDEDALVHVSVSRSSARFECGGVALTTALIEGAYPNWRQIIPQHSDNAAIVGRDELTAALKRVSILASAAAPCVRFGFGGKKIELSAKDAAHGSASDEVACRYKGEAVAVTFNPGYVIDALSRMQSDEAQIAVADAGSPAVITGDAGFRYVVMPMRVEQQHDK